MKIFKCRICKQPYLGKEMPPNCAHCGAFSKYFQEANKIIEEDFSLDEETQNYLKNIYEEKLRNRLFYKEASKSMENEALRSIFEVFKNIEGAHIQILERLGIQENLLEKAPKLYEFEEDNLTESFQRKKNLLDYQQRILKRLFEPFLVELLNSFIEIEESHLKILEEYM